MEKHELEALVKQVVSDAIETERRSAAALIRSVKVVYTRVAGESGCCTVNGPHDTEAMFQELADLMEMPDQTFTVTLRSPGAGIYTLKVRARTRDHAKQMMIADYGESYTIEIV